MVSGSKTWDKMTDAEKIETSRLDIVRLFDITNHLIQDVRSLRQTIQSLEAEVQAHRLKGR